MPISLTGFFPSFFSGNRLIDGGDLANLSNILFSTTTGITATPAGTQANSIALTSANNEVTVVATAADGVKLPQAIIGQRVYISNATATSMQVFGQTVNPNVVDAGPDRIIPNGSSTLAAAATGVAQAGHTMMVYVCLRAGVWKQGSMA